MPRPLHRPKIARGQPCPGLGNHFAPKPKEEVNHLNHKRITAQLDDVEEGLRLTIVHEDGAYQPAPVMVADLAAAGREINSFLEDHPGHSVARAGDGRRSVACAADCSVPFRRAASGRPAVSGG